MLEHEDLVSEVVNELRRHGELAYEDYEVENETMLCEGARTCTPCRVAIPQRFDMDRRHDIVSSGVAEIVLRQIVSSQWREIAETTGVRRLSERAKGGAQD